MQEARQIIVIQVCYSLYGGMEIVAHHTHSIKHYEHHQYVLDILRDWTAFQHKPNLRRPIAEGECLVEDEARPTIITHSC